MSEKLQEVVMGERKFLHDISNYLVVAQGMGNFVNKKVSQDENVDEKIKERMQKVINAVEQMVEMVKERRSELHSVSADKQ